MQRRTFLQTSAALAVTASLPTLSSAAGANPFPYPLTHAVTDASAPEVFFTKDISPAGLIKIYDRLGQKRQGKVGVKVCFETPNGPHLDPKLVHAFADHVNGKLLDCTYYPPRDTVEKHLEVAKGNGFDTSRIDIIDAEGTVDLPIEGGKHLKFSRIGSHYNDYDTMIGLCRFKSHHIEFYGGMLKNLSIAIAPMEGKWLIHSAGKTDSGFSPSDNHIETQAMADYVKGVMDAKKGRWVFLTVLDAVAPTDAKARRTSATSAFSRARTPSRSTGPRSTSPSVRRRRRSCAANGKNTTGPTSRATPKPSARARPTTASRRSTEKVARILIPHRE